MKISRTTMAVAAFAVALALISIAPARAADPLAPGLRETKKPRSASSIAATRFVARCRGLPNRTIRKPTSRRPTRTIPIAAKKSRPLLGVPIVLNMKPSGGNKWQGKVYNAEDGGTYTGFFTMTGANTAQLKGCVMGGIICKGQTWTRAN